MCFKESSPDRQTPLKNQTVWYQNVRFLKKCWVIFYLIDKEIIFFFHMIWWLCNLKREKEPYLSRGWLGSWWQATSAIFSTESKRVCVYWGWICSAFEARSALIKRVGFIDITPPEGSPCHGISFFGAKLRFLSMPQQRGRAWVPVRSCPQLWVGAAFPGCQQGVGQAASGFTVQQCHSPTLGTVNPLGTRHGSTCFCLGPKVSPAASRLVLAPPAGNHFYSVPPYVNWCRAVGDALKPEDVHEVTCSSLQKA